MLSELVQLSFDKIMQTHAYTVIILNAREKRFAIYTEPATGRSLQLYLTKAEKPRPLTHDLISMIFEGFEIKLLQVVINDVQDTTFLARLFLEQQINGITHILEMDARPSDCIIMALMHNVPLYCTREVLDKTIPVEE
jgi:uncharacterized protein